MAQKIKVGTANLSNFLEHHRGMEQKWGLSSLMDGIWGEMCGSVDGLRGTDYGGRLTVDGRRAATSVRKTIIGGPNYSLDGRRLTVDGGRGGHI